VAGRNGHSLSPPPYFPLSLSRSGNICSADRQGSVHNEGRYEQTRGTRYVSIWSCIDLPRASSERTHRHVGYRANDKSNPLRTLLADLVLWHRADPCAQIAVDLR